jgi:hypothetical protein
MFTQAMPALVNAMSGSMSQNAMRQLMQVLGNCNQPLEHRGPVAINTAARQSERGVYDGSRWDPGQFQDIASGPSIFNNGAFVDSSVNNQFFREGDFLFRTDAQFTTNNLFQTIILGGPGPPGAAGAAGANGVDGAPGAVGAAGAAGAAGRPGIGFAGAPGQRGTDGLAGPPGQRGVDGLDGLPGRPGRDGRDGIGGGYTLSERSRGVPVRGVLDGVSVQVTGTVNVPVFNPETCDVTETPIDIVADAQVQVTRRDYSIPVPTYKLDPKPVYP